jgi:hypothetical protein
MVASVAGMTGMPSLFCWDGVLWTFSLRLTWNHDPSDVSFPIELGWQVHATRPIYWLLGSCKLFVWGWPQVMFLLISASWKARITCTRQWHLESCINILNLHLWFSWFVVWIWVSMSCDFLSLSQLCFYSCPLYCYCEIDCICIYFMPNHNLYTYYFMHLSFKTFKKRRNIHVYFPL